MKEKNSYNKIKKNNKIFLKNHLNSLNYIIIRQNKVLFQQISYKVFNFGMMKKIQIIPKKFKKMKKKIKKIQNVINNKMIKTIDKNNLSQLDI